MLIDIQTKGTAEINDQINECELGTHQCSENAACQDLKVCHILYVNLTVHKLFGV